METRATLLALALLSSCAVAPPALRLAADERQGACLAACRRELHPMSLALARGGACRCWAPLQEWETAPRATAALLRIEP